MTISSLLWWIIYSASVLVSLQTYYVCDCIVLTQFERWIIQAMKNESARLLPEGNVSNNFILVVITQLYVQRLEPNYYIAVLELL